jgi:hypothetical protein
MIQVPSSVVRKDFAHIMDSAQKEAIIVRKHDKDYVAIISMNDYKQLVRLKNRRLQHMADQLAEEARKNGLTAEILETILNDDA